MGWRDHLDEKEAERIEREQRGRRAVRAGQSAEDAVDAVCRWYEQRGWAVVRKRPTPTRVASRHGGRPRIYHEARAGVDYSGTVRGPRAVHFECKRTNRSSLPLDTPKGPMLRREQAAELAAAAALGAVAAVLVMITHKPRSARREIERWFWLPWSGWQAAAAAAEADNRKSLGLDLLLEHGVEVPPHPLLGGPDWLLALEAAEPAS